MARPPSKNAADMIAALEVAGVVFTEAGDGMGPYPTIVCFSTYRDSVRTIPVLQHDQGRPEDLDTEGEDHAADEWRYGCMARPWIKDAPVPVRKKADDYKPWRRSDQSHPMLR